MINELSDETEIGEAAVLNSRFEGIPIGDVKLPGNALIMGIRRAGSVIVPHGDTALSVDDIVMLVGNPDRSNFIVTLSTESNNQVLVDSLLKSVSGVDAFL